MVQKFTSKQEQIALKVLRSGVEQKYNYEKENQNRKKN